MNVIVLGWTKEVSLVGPGCCQGDIFVPSVCLLEERCENKKKVFYNIEYLYDNAFQIVHTNKVDRNIQNIFDKSITNQFLIVALIFDC